MRCLVLLMVLLAGCGTGRSQFSRDLSAAEGSCTGQAWPSKTAAVACLHERERSVWAREEPDTLDLYEAFAARRDALAREYDRGLMNQADYDAKLAALKSDALAQLKARRESGTR
jgi:hypothetical protein